MQLFHPPYKLLITGGSGTGKTTFWTRFVLGYRAQTKFIFDSEGELSLRLGTEPATTALAAAASIPSGWVIYDPEPMFGSATDRAFAFFCEFAFQASAQLPGTKLFACDELSALVDVQTLSPELRDILQRGRRRGLDFVGVAHQPNELNNKARSQFTEAVSFQQIDDCAIKWLAKSGFDEAELRALLPGQFVCRNLRGRGSTRGQVF